MAEATKNVLKDAGAVISDTAHEAVSAAVDTAHIALTAVKNKRSEFEDAMDETRRKTPSCLRTKASWTTIMWTTTICSTTPARRAMEFPPGRNRFPRRRPLRGPAAEPAPAEEPAEPDQTVGAEKVTIEEDTI